MVDTPCEGKLSVTLYRGEPVGGQDVVEVASSVECRVRRESDEGETQPEPRRRRTTGIVPALCKTGWMTRHDPMRFMENIFGIFGHPSSTTPVSPGGSPKPSRAGPWTAV